MSITKYNDGALLAPIRWRNNNSRSRANGTLISIIISELLKLEIIIWSYLYECPNKLARIFPYLFN